MSDEISGEPPKYQAFRRGLRSRRRDDPALDLFLRAETNFTDVERVDRILLELSRCYNPLTNGPIVDLTTRRSIIEFLQAARVEDARRLFEQCLARYAPPVDDRTPGPS